MNLPFIIFYILPKKRIPLKTYFNEYSPLPARLPLFNFYFKIKLEILP